MIKKQIILPTLLLATTLIGGITGCTNSKPSDVSQGDNSSGTKVSDTNSSTPSSPGANTPSRAEKREAVRKEIEAVLTPDQVKELSTKLQQGERMHKAVLSLNLTVEQKTKIQNILKAAYPQR